MSVVSWGLAAAWLGCGCALGAQGLAPGAAPPAVAAPPPKTYQGQLVSFNFQTVEVRTLLQLLAHFSGFNIIVSDGVTGSTSLRVRDLPWDQVLDIVVQSRGLTQRQEGSVIWVGTRAEQAARQRQELDGQQTLQTVEPVLTESFRLNYARADEVARQLQLGPAASRVLSVRGSVMPEARTNQLFVTDVAARIAMVRRVIEQLDIAVRQVVIEARIVEAGDSFGRSIGARLGGRLAGRPANPAQSGWSGGQVGGGYIMPRQPDTGEALIGRDFGIAGSDLVNLPAQAQAGQPAAALAVSLFNASLTRVLNLEISALEADGKGKVVASPRIVTADQVKAIIEQGTELPYQQAAGSGATSLTFRKANLKLEVTPQIAPDGRIILNVDINKDSVGRSTPNGFAIDTKHVQTQVRVDDGGTVMIGGIFETVEREDEARVPMLGSLPGLGALFRSRTRSLAKSELLVFLTPQVLVDPPRSVAP
ncbi:MAG: type IV pilus secretin PilQ [Betaproteobacteria bacterium]